MLACLPMLAAVLLAQRWLAATGLPGGMRLCALVVIGGATFVPSALALAPRASREFQRLLAGARTGHGGGAGRG